LKKAAYQVNQDYTKFLEDEVPKLRRVAEEEKMKAEEEKRRAAKAVEEREVVAGRMKQLMTGHTQVSVLSVSVSVSVSVPASISVPVSVSVSVCHST